MGVLTRSEFRVSAFVVASELRGVGVPQVQFQILPRISSGGKGCQSLPVSKLTAVTNSSHALCVVHSRNLVWVSCAIVPGSNSQLCTHQCSHPNFEILLMSLTRVLRTLVLTQFIFVPGFPVGRIQLLYQINYWTIHSAVKPPYNEPLWFVIRRVRYEESST